MNRFHNFFLTSLGSSFLRIFYKAFLKSPGILLVLEDEGEVKGFVAGTRDNRGFYKKIVKNNFLSFFLIGIKFLFAKPASLLRVGYKIIKSDKNNIIFAELLSIASKKNKRGYGKLLLKGFESEVNNYNPDLLPVALTTDYDENEKAVQFYRDSGYVVLEVFESFRGRKMYRFIKYFNNI
ncbi:MAG: hypothetical protein ABS44_05435 [Chryseobacterium sp. SCN 40-13]|nr:MAG: hypothetical protein ABS44_05435 [Chryseobacterium sp. SCN 40-13]